VPLQSCRRVAATPPLDVLILEGWCVGFQPLGRVRIEQQWAAAKSTKQKLAHVRIEVLFFIDSELQRYYDTFMGCGNFDILIHLDILDLDMVYVWREEQERMLRQRTNGSGMKPAEVVMFGKSTLSLVCFSYYKS
jgi:D-glycerate 3-kinase